MRFYDSGLTAALSAARDSGIAPVYFVWITGKDRDSGDAVKVGFWSRSHDKTVNVPLPDGSGSETRLYLGGCGLQVAGIGYVADLTDNPVSVSLSQIADAAQYAMRGLDLRLASVEIHATTMTGGALVGPPQMAWDGIVDEGSIATPAPRSDGGISFAVRSEILTMLSAINPAKSSDAHQKRRAVNDRFSEYGSTISSRKVQWYTGED